MTWQEASFSRMGAQLTGSAIRQMGILAAGRPDLISFAPGYPDPSTFAWQAYRDIADDLLRGGHEDTLQYGQTRGYAPLIEAVVPRLRAQGITCTSDEVLLTTGSQQAVDLVTRLFVDPGDVVLVELPTFTGAIAAFRSSGARLVGVRQEADGLDLAHLDAVLAAERAAGRRVKFLYVIPNFQNPTGGILSLAKRRALLDWSAREQVLIVEDDPYGDLWFPDVTRLDETRPIKADDADGRVIYLQSTSKTLAPTFRTAWVVAPTAVIARLDVAKQSADLCSSSLDQRIVHQAIVRGVLDRQLPLLRETYARKRDVMSRALSAQCADVAHWTPPRGGFFLWVVLPEGIDTRALLRAAIEAQVIYVAGAPFYVDGTGANALRLAFSAASASRIEEGIGRLAGVVRAAVGASAPSVPQAGR
ncbi:2-aminoadipate transaminase [Luteitalea pratensis]|uniref:2-aminoadipate transaminase n=1 Tax=Luteitalea pratensis TaxID=1855912 RepID=A0A143PR63_LUTPR|nr:PLP-dependent aminotransferase family protein [Luteitalea pratensis]AMY10304.1 2-aminoadipate transaminase [Luteitalea pratensis]